MVTYQRYRKYYLLHLLVDLFLISAAAAAGWYFAAGKHVGLPAFYPSLLLFLPAYVVSRAVFILIGTVWSFRHSKYLTVLMTLLHLLLIVSAGIVALFFILLPIAGVSTNPPG